MFAVKKCSHVMTPEVLLINPDIPLTLSSQTRPQDGHLELAPAFLYLLYLTLCVPKVSVLKLIFTSERAVVGVVIRSVELMI